MKIRDPFLLILEGLETRHLCFADDGPDDSGGGAGDNPGDGGEPGDEGGDEVAAKPEYVPEKFWDPTKGEFRTEAAMKSYVELERQQSKKGAELKAEWEKEAEAARLANRPEDPSKYNVQIPKDYEEMGIGIDDDDPTLGFWREMAHELGLDEKAFNKGLVGYIDARIKAAPNLQAEMDKLGDTAKVRTEAVGRWAARTFPEGELSALETMTVTAEGVLALERVMAMVEKGGPPSSSQSASTFGSQTTLSELQALQNDPRYWDPMQRDPNFVKKIDDGFAKLYSDADK